MGKSYRKTPVTSWSAGRHISEKKDKRIYNRELRRKVRHELTRQEEPFTDIKEISDPWLMAKDGKQRFDPEKHPKLMRK